MSKNKSSRERAVRASDEEPMDWSGVMAAMARSQSKILAQMDSSTKDLNVKIDSIRDDMTKRENRLKDLLRRSEVRMLRLKLDNLEGRQHALSG